MSSSGIIIPIVPFCPAREHSLSPIAGMRSSRIRTFAMRFPSSPSVIKALSTNPSCPFLGALDESTKVPGFTSELVHLPITIFLSSSGVFSLIKPFLSR